MVDIWEKFTLMEKMGNIASEVYRTIKRKQDGDSIGAENSFYMVLVLYDKSVNCHSQEVGFVKEAELFREVFCDYFWDGSDYDVSAEQIMDYLMPFALKARQGVV